MTKLEPMIFLTKSKENFKKDATKLRYIPLNGISDAFPIERFACDMDPNSCIWLSKPHHQLPPRQKKKSDRLARKVALLSIITLALLFDCSLVSFSIEDGS